METCSAADAIMRGGHETSIDILTYPKGNTPADNLLTIV